jgi:hypothetical protein
MIEGVGDSLPAILSTAVAMIVMSIITLVVAKRSGVSDIQAVASRESDRLVKAQAGQIKVLKDDAARKDIRIQKLEKALADAFIRIDKLEKLVTNDQIKKLDREI